MLDLRRREVVQSGIEDGVGVNGCEQRIEVGVGLEQGGFTVVVGGRQGRELDVNSIVGVGRIAGNLSLCVTISIPFARPREESRTCAVQKHSGSGAALAVDRGYHSHGVDMSHNVLCGEDRLHALILAGKAAAQVGRRFGDGQVIGSKARL